MNLKIGGWRELLASVGALLALGCSEAGEDSRGEAHGLGVEGPLVVRDVKLGELREVDLKVKNEGRGDVKVLAVTSSCACVYARRGSLVVAEGKVGSLPMTVRGTKPGVSDEKVVLRVEREGREEGVVTARVIVSVDKPLHVLPESPAFVMVSEEVREKALEVIVLCKDADSAQLKVQCDNERIVPFVGQKIVEVLEKDHKVTYYVGLAVGRAAAGVEVFRLTLWHSGDNDDSEGYVIAKDGSVVVQRRT